MIEKIVLDYLTEKLNVLVSTETPETPPESYVIIEKTGSGGANRIESATMAIQSYGMTMLEAAELNEKMKEAMKDIIDLDSISKVKLNSDYNYTDMRTKRYRYQAVYDLIYL